MRQKACCRVIYSLLLRERKLFEYISFKQKVLVPPFKSYDITPNQITQLFLLFDMSFDNWNKELCARLKQSRFMLISRAKP